MKQPEKSIQISTGTRVYYADLFKDRKGEEYITLSEIPTDTKPGKKKRGKVFIHRNHLQRVIDSLVEISKAFT